MNQISWKNFVGVANASRKCSDVFKFRARLASQCCLLFKATPYCFFIATIVSSKTMTSLRLRANFKLHIFKLKSLQLNQVKFSRKSYPRVGKAFVLNNPLYNLKISDYFWRNDDFSHSAAPKSPVFSIIVRLPWQIHAWLAHLNGSLICVNVRPFLPMNEG